MESTKNKVKGNEKLSIADLLCSVGYLPPRNEQDLERFERIYRGRKVETTYIVNADALFDKVTGEENSRIRSMATIYSRPGSLRVAESATTSNDESVGKVLSNLIKGKKD